MKDLMGLLDILKCTPIDKGWSSDKKFLLMDSKGKKYLLRLSDISKEKEKDKEYEMISSFSSLGFTSSTPIIKGITKDGNRCFMILGWVEGEDLEEKLPQLSMEEQRRLGSEAGRILSSIHSETPF